MPPFWQGRAPQALAQRGQLSRARRAKREEDEVVAKRLARPVQRVAAQLVDQRVERSRAVLDDCGGELLRGAVALHGPCLEPPVRVEQQGLGDVDGELVNRRLD